MVNKSKFPAICIPNSMGIQNNTIIPFLKIPEWQLLFIYNFSRNHRFYRQGYCTCSQDHSSHRNNNLL